MPAMKYGERYLKQYGWSSGEALQQGGLSKPVLVKHKFDTKGLGANPQDNVAWWERVFDGQLKGMQLGDQGFVQSAAAKAEWDLADRRANSPLYKVFVKGQGLKGSMKEDPTVVQVVEESQLMVFDSDSEDERRTKAARKRAKAAKKQHKMDKAAKKAAKMAKREAKDAKKAKKAAKKVKRAAKKTTKA